jgi:hypothetical protein
MINVESETNFDLLIAKMDGLRAIAGDGARWAQHSANRHRDNYLHNLETQGRSGEGPPLSKFTRDNPSDGSGIRDWVEVEVRRSPRKTAAVCGIANERAAMIARVQDKGTTIKVTEEMRNYFASTGATPPAMGSVIEVPGRRSWERAIAQSRGQAVAEIKVVWEKYRGGH